MGNLDHVVNLDHAKVSKRHLKRPYKWGQGLPVMFFENLFASNFKISILLISMCT
jgi:hypothetical protein